MTTTPPISAFATGYEAISPSLLGGKPLYIGSRGAQPGACTVLAPYGGTTHPTTPKIRLAVQVMIYDTDQETAHIRAWAAYRALHRKAAWTLGAWHARGVWCKETPFEMPAEPGQGGLLYRVAFNVYLDMITAE